jgi:hypothetical protein
MLLLSRLQPLPPLLLSLLPLLVAAGNTRAAAAERRPGPGSRLLLKLKPPRARSCECFQNEGWSAESDSDKGYDDFLQTRAEMKKCRAAKKRYCLS